MHVLNVNSSLDLETGSGTAERTVQISRHLVRRGVRCTVLALDLGLNAERLGELEGVEVVTVPCAWRRFFVPRLGRAALRAIAHAVREADVIHMTGHWSVLNAVVYHYARRYGKPYLLCPAGTLPRSGRSPRLKRLYNLLVGDRLLANAAGFVAVTAGEFPDFAAYGVDAGRVTVLPNGIDAARAAVSPAEERAAPQFVALAPYLLFVGRLHPVKGPDLLLEAYARLAAGIPHRLVFIGPDDGIRASLEEAATTHGVGDRVLFLGYKAGGEKAAAFRHADLLVIPSRREAMSLVVLEAAVAGTPSLITDQCGFDEIRAIDPRLVVPASAEGLQAGLQSLLPRREELRALGAAMRAYALERYGWDAAIERLIGLCTAARRRAASGARS